jgi:pimeloyl-ACP methyl ester carboxylesterase
MPRLPGVEHRFVDVGDARLHVAEAGDGPPLLLLHGWPQHWWAWRGLIPELARTHRVIAPDLRGWGWSDAPPGDYAKSALAADVLALLNREGIQRASVMGHDWGGYVGFLLALEHPTRVERLVALDIAPPWRGRLLPKHALLPLLGSYQALLATPGLGPLTMTSGNRFVRAVIRGSSGPYARWDDAALDTYASVLRDPARAAASSACYRTFLTRELPAVLAGGDRSRELRVPTLLVMGEASPIRRVVDPQPAQNLSVESIADAGHFLPEEAPGEVLGLALPFLLGPNANPGVGVRAYPPTKGPPCPVDRSLSAHTR